MKCLVVVCHPLEDSLCHALAHAAVESLAAAGHSVEVEDLYRPAFAPALSADERRCYYAAHYDAAAVEAQAARLLVAEALLLVFPTWWFGFPAVLKGWFDRVWAPGIAYDHAVDLGAIRPRLHGLRRTLAVTTLGSPWWVDRFLLRQPVKRVLRDAIIRTCAPSCRFEMLSLYRAEAVTAQRYRTFSRRIERALAAWR
jgi:NAD(P)H dehydrogenase (quinone)